MSWFFTSVIWPPANYTPAEKVQKSLDKRVAALSVQASSYDVVQSILSRIEQKSGVLLTHVSLMVALTGALWALDIANSQTLVLLSGTYFGLHLVAYLVVALFCIRCQFHIDQKFYDEMPKGDFSNSIPQLKERDEKKDSRYNLEIGFKNEIVLRERLFRFSLTSLYLITIEFAIAVLLEVVLHLLGN